MKNTIILMLAVVLAVSCKKEKPKEEEKPHDHEESNEFITTVKLRFENNADPTDTLWATWQDLTPDDAVLPDTTKALASLKKNKTYTVKSYFWDETKNPAVDITEEIAELANQHRLFLIPQGAFADKLTITPLDYDTQATPLPVGLRQSIVTANAASSGRMQLVLKHQPLIKDGLLTTGSTDIDIFFRISIVD